MAATSETPTRPTTAAIQTLKGSHFLSRVPPPRRGKGVIQLRRKHHHTMTTPNQTAPKLTLSMDIPEAERRIDIQAETIQDAALKLLQQLHQEFSSINPDVLEALA